MLGGEKRAGVPCSLVQTTLALFWKPRGEGKGGKHRRALQAHLPKLRGPHCSLYSLRTTWKKWLAGIQDLHAKLGKVSFGVMGIPRPWVGPLLAQNGLARQTATCQCINKSSQFSYKSSPSINASSCPLTLLAEPSSLPSTPFLPTPAISPFPPPSPQKCQKTAGLLVKHIGLMPICFVSPSHHSLSAKS